ncbi:hypothetical protein GGQ87_000379 [Brevundimonas alba]|uniref:DUF2066 domain-containing protein n=1 Tax=Brevundimonas alba TaxID=74314 RepID=A0A7X5YHM4_9CAUL|nr:hypothetical protein [Brevundimonas alba]NJC40121.1 hypothetical protein [Brevundimonas alba]
MTIGQNAAAAKAALLAAALLGAAGPAWAGVGAAGTYYERAFVVAADARCNLFAPQVDAALGAATAQARGAALRSGSAEADLNAAAARARARAGAVSCRDPELETVRARVAGAFAGWTRTPRMTFAGGRQPWIADRTKWAAPGWRLKQASTTGASPVAIGYGGDALAGDLTAVVSFVGRSRPNAARLVFRDEAKAPRAWLSGGGLAPAASRASVWATGVSAADPALLAEGRRGGEAWRFPASVADRLARLDPRETFLVEFHFRDGSVATARFEAGDFAAGRAFMSMGAL